MMCRNEFQTALLLHLPLKKAEDLEATHPLIAAAASQVLQLELKVPQTESVGHNTFPLFLHLVFAIFYLLN